MAFLINKSAIREIVNLRGRLKICLRSSFPFVFWFVTMFFQNSKATYNRKEKIKTCFWTVVHTTIKQNSHC